MSIHERGDGEEAGGGRALRADAQRNRSHILDVAWRMLTERSLEDVRMEEVAREAGIGKGTLYRHYPTRECLFDALVSDGAERIAATMRACIPPEADAATKLRAVVAIVYDVYERYNVSADLLFNARIPGGEHHHQAVRAIITRVRAILEQGVREGSFRPLDVDFAAMATFGLISPILFAKQRHHLGYTRAELEERVLDLLLHAIRAG